MRPVSFPVSRTSRWSAAALAGLALLGPATLPAAGPRPGERAGYQVGYTAHRTNLPGGRFANFTTSRAFVVDGE